MNVSSIKTNNPSNTSITPQPFVKKYRPSLNKFPNNN